MIGPRGCMKATEISILGPQRVHLAFPNWIEDLYGHLFESLKSDLIYLFRSCVFSPPFFLLGLLGRWRVMISKTWAGCLGDKCVLFHPNNICVCSTIAAEKYTNSAICYTLTTALVHIFVRRKIEKIWTPSKRKERGSNASRFIERKYVSRTFWQYSWCETNR